MIHFNTVKQVLHQLAFCACNKLFLGPLCISQALYATIMRSSIKKLGNNNKFSRNIHVLNGSHFSVGHNNKLGQNLSVYDFEQVEIGDNCLLSHDIKIISGSHLPNNSRQYKPGPIRIGNDVWIGINVTIIGPVTIGNNVIIGASSLVLNDIPNGTIVYGLPARPSNKKEL